MEEAQGEIIAYTDDDCEPDAAWLTWLAWSFERGGWDACGGPNLPPLPADDARGRMDDEAVVAAAPGAPSHVMLNDLEAEHLPGCNLVVKKSVLKALEGFDPTYRVAGDDVDLCWRLAASGYRMGFCGGAFVWHRRRTTLWRYFKQQRGYGKAEALLMRKHPEKFRRGGGARWNGRVYVGGAMCADAGSVIYHGPMGGAAYQQLVVTMQPRRPLPPGFQGRSVRWKLALAETLQPVIRSVARWYFSLRWRDKIQPSPRRTHQREKRLGGGKVMQDAWWGTPKMERGDILQALIEDGWRVIESDDVLSSDWDLKSKDDVTCLLVACERYEKQTCALIRLKTFSGEGWPVGVIKTMERLGWVRDPSD
jgi:hypothetical protein